jgi:integrase
MMCVKCKKEIPEGAVFCNWCGKKQGTKKQKTRRRARGSGSICKDRRNRDRPYIARAVPLRIGEHGAYIGAYATVKEAQAAIEQYEQGKRPDLYNADLAKIYDLWSANHFETLSESGVQGYRAAYKSCADLHRRTFRDIKTADFQRVIDHHAADGASRSKLEKIRQLCSQLCKYAMQNDIIDKNYASFVKLPKAEKKEKQIFTVHDRAVLWEHTDDKRVQIIIVMIYTGFRIGEIAALKPSDVYFKDGYMIGGEKTEAGKNRVVPFPGSVPEVERYVRAWCADCKTETLLGVTADYLRKYIFYPTLAELGLIAPPIKSSTTGKNLYINPRLTPHSTRHTFASLSVASGVAPDDLQKIIGHADFETTADIYVHKNIDQLKSAMNKLKK